MNPQLTQLIERLNGCCMPKMSWLDEMRAAEILSPLVEDRDAATAGAKLANEAMARLSARAEAAEAQIRECNEQIRTLREALKPEYFERRITEYFALGGLFNPELMEHENVRDLFDELLTAFRAALATPPNAPKGTTTI